MKICDKQLCTGCLACKNVCPRDAISLIENTKGFIYPLIQESECIHCNRCINVCPVNKTINGFEYRSVYAALTKNDKVRLESSSGGIFFCLARWVINKNGFVFGAVLCNDMVVRHKEAHTIEELSSLRKSKYVQSEINFSYQKVEKRLKEGHIVLFSGTPCQIAALRSYLQMLYSKLFCIDVLCHGVPSPGMFKKYIGYEESISKSQMTDMLFRSKSIGWKKFKTERFFKNGQKAQWSDSFVPGFLNNYYLRESCYNCKYASEYRQGDISLGDYWGYVESKPEYIEDDDKGISLVIINTEKGERLFKSIKREIAYAPRTMENAKQGNAVLYKPCDKPECYENFWKDAEVLSWGELKKKYIPEQDTEEWMSKEMRDYFDIPYVKRHRKHKMQFIFCGIIRKIKTCFQNIIIMEL